MYQEFIRNGRDPRFLSSIDPSIYCLRDRILEGAIRGLLTGSDSVRDSGIEEKRKLAVRISHGLWRGYVLALAYSRVTNQMREGFSSIERSYLWTVFTDIFGPEPGTEMARLEIAEPVVIAMSRIHNRLFEDLIYDMSALPALVTDSPLRDLMDAFLASLITMGFGMWVAQRAALGAFRTSPS